MSLHEQWPADCAALTHEYDRGHDFASHVADCACASAGLANWPRMSDAYREALVAYFPQIRRRARRLTQGAVEGEDLAQKTFVRALENADRYRHLTDVGPLLNTILKNLFLDSVRAKHRLVFVEDMEAVQMPEGSGPREPAPSERFDTADVKAVLPKLRPEFREAFELFEFEQRSYDEIAVQQGVPRRTVGSRIYRARIKIRSLLTEAQTTESPHD